MGIEAGRELWASPELTMREKAVVLVAADIAVPELGLPLELHLGMGLKQAGMSVEHFREVLRHIAPDAGYNITAMAFGRLVEIAAALGFDTESRAQPTDPAPTDVYPPTAREALQRLDPKFARQVDRQARQLWQRPLLSRRERCLATLAVDVVGVTLGAPFEAHLDLATEAGLSPDELRALLRILAEFSIPKAWEAMVVLSRRLDAH
jgi:alkylhydroperoxidase/carboxymuconolactone decarboxylase family protein YurZ